MLNSQAEAILLEKLKEIRPKYNGIEVSHLRGSDFFEDDDFLIIISAMQAAYKLGQSEKVQSEGFGFNQSANNLTSLLAIGKDIVEAVPEFDKDNWCIKIYPTMPFEQWTEILKYINTKKVLSTHANWVCESGLFYGVSDGIRIRHHKAFLPEITFPQFQTLLNNKG